MSNEFVEELVRLGFDRKVAETQVRGQLAMRTPLPAVEWRKPTKEEQPLVAIMHAAHYPLRWPLKIVLPWSALESDNRKHGAVIVHTGTGKLIPKLIMQAAYRAAKAKARAVARETVDGSAPVAFPLALVARVWLPAPVTSKKYDVCNFAKCAHDALIGVVYTDDQWLHDVRWIRAGVDVDRPRADITITPL